jgi:hypothetical protein
MAEIQGARSNRQFHNCNRPGGFFAVAGAYAGDKRAKIDYELLVSDPEAVNACACSGKRSKSWEDDPSQQRQPPHRLQA